MKNTRLIVLFFNMALLLLWDAEYAAASDVVAQNLYYKAGQNYFITSGTLYLPYLELKGSVTSDFQKKNWNIAFNSKKLIPFAVCNLKAGNISGGGSLSKLNSPELTFGTSPFISATSLKTTKLTCSQASYDSFSKSTGIFTQLSFGRKDGLLDELDFSFCYDTNSFTSSLNLKKAFDKNSISLNFTGGLYPYKKANQESWFNDRLYYHSGKHICSYAQLCFSFPAFSTVISSGIYESPFGKYETVYRMENRLKLKNFVFELNGFYNPDERIITSSDKKLSPLLQIQSAAGIQINKLRIAGKTQADINLGEKTHCIKNTIGTGWNINTFEGSVQAYSIINVEEKNDSLKFELGKSDLKTVLGLYIGDVKPELNFKFSITPDHSKGLHTFNESLKLKCTYYGKFDLSGYANLELEQKNKKNKNKFTAGAELKIKIKWFSLKVEVDIEV